MRRFVTAVVGLMTFCAAPAEAAERTGTPAVAAQNGDAVLSVQDTTSGGLCLDISYAGQQRPDTACLRPSTRARDDLRPRTFVVGSTTIVYGAVSEPTAALELTLSSGRPVRLRTQFGDDYDGRHAATRFYLAQLRGTPTIAATRAIGRGGRSRAAIDLNPLALPPFKGRATLATLADELSRPSDLVALDTKILAATKRDPGRRKRALCIGLRRRGVAPVPGRAVCARRTTRLEIRFAADCTSGRSIHYGFAPDVVRRATAVLKDGTTRPMRRLKLPDRLGHTAHALLLEMSTGTVREIHAFDRAGRRIATLKLTGGDC